MPKGQAFNEALKKRVREICGHACAFCGQQEEGRLQVHHIENRGMGGDRSKNTIQNLILLCNLCHHRVTAGEVKILDWAPGDPNRSVQLMIAEMDDGKATMVHWTRLDWYRRKPIIKATGALYVGDTKVADILNWKLHWSYEVTDVSTFSLSWREFQQETQHWDGQGDVHWVLPRSMSGIRKQVLSGHAKDVWIVLDAPDVIKAGTTEGKALINGNIVMHATRFAGDVKVATQSGGLIKWTGVNGTLKQKPPDFGRLRAETSQISVAR